MTCKVCEAVELLKVMGAADVLAGMKAERDRAITQGYATKADANALLDLIQASEIVCRGCKCDHGQGNTRINEMREVLPERVPVHLFSALFSDFDLAATSIVVNT